MLYLIGLGLNFDGISKFGLATVKKCKKVYLESYTVNFPYPKMKIESIIGKKVALAKREFVESLSIVDEAAKKDVALLVYGSPLTATTHISILDEAKKSRVKAKVIYSASILDAIGATGLQIYKFGKTTSMPKWDAEKNFKPESFIEAVKENQKIDAHSLILIDIGLRFPEAVRQLKQAAENHDVNVDRIVICQCLGTQQEKILYRKIDEAMDYKINLPYCIIIPGKLHFIEKEFLDGFS